MLSLSESMISSSSARFWRAFILDSHKWKGVGSVCVKYLLKVRFRNRVGRVNGIRLIEMSLSISHKGVLPDMGACHKR